MTTTESNEATQIASNLEATKIIVSVKNHPLVQRINLKEVLSEKMITAKTDHLNLINTQINLPLEEKAIPSVQKIIQINLLTKLVVHLTKMIHRDRLTEKKDPLIKETASNVPTEAIHRDRLIEKKVLLIKEIVSNALTEMIHQDLLTEKKALLIKEIVSNAPIEMILQDLSTEKKVHLIKEIHTSVSIRMTVPQTIAAEALINHLTENLMGIEAEILMKTRALTINNTPNVLRRKLKLQQKMTV